MRAHLSLLHVTDHAIVFRTVVHTHALVPNAKQSLFGATHLVTPLGSYPHAVLRDEDVVLIETSVSHEQLHALLRENPQLRGSS
jgi:hypothetical protein